MKIFVYLKGAEKIFYTTLMFMYNNLVIIKALALINMLILQTVYNTSVINLNSIFNTSIANPQLFPISIFRVCNGFLIFFEHEYFLIMWVNNYDI